jgi:hypothetical protein
MTPDFRRGSDATTQPATGSHRDGNASAADDRLDALPPGTRLHEFELLDVIGTGGFGIVYLAQDHTLLRRVAVKEYLPVDFARRSPEHDVVPRRSEHASTFAMGLRSFLREAQLLAGFDHPALVKVHRFWEANGTAYMAMPYYAGATLKQVRRDAGAPPDEHWLRSLLDPLLAALEVLHAAHVYHRDISPDNVILTPQGRPVLLDFGSARQVAGDRTQALTAVFKPSFAAIEQYGDVPGLRQGPWTDLYGLAGVVHFMILGSAPVPAAMRAVHDPQRPLVAAAAGRGCSAAFLQAIDWALAVRPEQRPASVEAFRAVLGGRALPPHVAALQVRTVATAGAAADLPSGAANDPALAVPRRLSRRFSRRALAMALAACTVVAGAATVLALGGAGRSADARTALVPGASGVTGMTGATSATAATAATGTTDPPAAAAPSTASGASAAPPSAPAHDRVAARGSRRAPPAGHAATGPATVAAASPRAACGDGMFLARAACMERLCREPAYRQHDECVPVRSYAEARRRAE